MKLARVLRNFFRRCTNLIKDEVLMKRPSKVKGSRCFAHDEMVYLDQFAGAKKESMIEKYGEIDDEKAARRFGARNVKEYSYWAWRACGISNVAMVLKSEGLWQGKLFELVQEGLLENGYVYRNKWGEEDVGWSHQSLIKMLRARGLQAESVSQVSLERVLWSVYKGRYAIVSVRSERGSHLVLVKGFDDSGDNLRILVNDPFGYKEVSGENLWLSGREFSKKFIRQAIFVDKG